MEYFKIITDNTIVGVITSTQFIRYSPATDTLLRCEKNRGEYVIYKDILYRDTWMNPTYITISYTPAIVLPIEEEEYNILFETLKVQDEIIIEDNDTGEPDIPDEPEPYEDTSTIDFIRTSKINEMSYNCRKAIEQGFDLDIRGETYHFSLTTQDQLNLMSLGTMAQTSDLIPYHADGETCMFYTAEEINQIISAMNARKIYHTTYYNALKDYINSLETIEEIASITYGTPIPDEYKSEALKVIEQ